MDVARPNTDKLLEMNQEEKCIRGTLKIFFGYAAGVGKTYAMLQSAHIAKESGVDVVVGYIEPYKRKDTMELLKGLETIPPLQIPYKNNLKLREFDLDSALTRKPELLIVDELAHTNLVNSKHTKRYQDIHELLNVGISVYTTVNLQDLESLSNIFVSITKISIKEKIPNFVFEQADQVELVDTDPQELLQRVKEGKVFPEKMSGLAMQKFYSLDNLAVLREIALNKAEERINKVTGKNRRQNQDNDYYTGEHILVCLSPSPSNAKVIRAASHMAAAFKAEFTAAYVEKPGRDTLQDRDAFRLRMNQRLAEQLGAKLITLYGGDVVKQIAEYARISGVSKIVLGKSYTRNHFFSKDINFTDQVTESIPNLEIYLIPDNHIKLYKNTNKQKSYSEKFSYLKDILLMISILGFCTLMAYLFRYLGVDEVNIVTIYILGVLLTAMATENQIYNILSSSLSVLCFNIFFTEPINSLAIDQPGYLITFFIMFVSGFITSSLAKKIKNYGEQAVRKAWRTQVLLETSQQIQMASGTDNIVKVVAEQLIRLLDRDIIYYPGSPDEKIKPYIFTVENGSEIEKILGKEEEIAASWCYNNNKHAGASTSTLSDLNGLYLAVRSPNRVYGVIGICLGNDYLPTVDEEILNAMLNEMAIALEKEKNLEEKTRVQMEMKQEKLRSNLLRSISHDLRTPLTSISGNSSVLLKQEDKLTQEQRKHLYEDIYENSVWLYNLVENLLSVTKIENIELKLQPELLEDVIEVAISHMKNKLKNHEVEVKLEQEYMMAWMEAKMIVQVIMNIIDNAVKYTSKGSHILVHAYEENKRIYISIADNGNGITDEEKKRIFDLFYTGESRCYDKSRSMGIGLSLCYSIIEAHGGQLRVYDNIPKGAKFEFDLKAEDTEQLER